MLRVALATCTQWPDLDVDGPELLAALAAEGLHVEVPSWDDPEVDWAAFDLVVIRTTWDYWDRHEEFLGWTRSVPRLLNSADVVAWNTDKTYLRRLESAGIPIVPTTWVAPGEPYDVPGFPYVVKPSVSAGARDTAAYEAGSPDSAEHVARLHALGKTVMLQPYVEAVDSYGETAVLVFDGEVSHAASKTACLVVGEGEPELGAWTIGPRTATAEEIALAERITEVVRGWGDDLLYARIDLLPGPLLIELEVTEPSLFLTHAPGSAQRYAAAVRRRAEQTSPGSMPSS